MNRTRLLSVSIILLASWMFLISVPTWGQGCFEILVQDNAECADSLGWVNVYGSIQGYNGNPLCAMALSNGQHMFSCNENLGQFGLTVPVDKNNEVKLLIFADGYLPFRVIYDAQPCTDSPPPPSPPPSPDGSDTGNNVCKNNCLKTWVECGIWCGFQQPNSTPCRSGCLKDYSWCLKDCLP